MPLPEYLGLVAALLTIPGSVAPDNERGLWQWCCGLVGFAAACLAIAGVS